MPVASAKSPGSAADDSKSGRARQANQAAHAGANISTAAPIKTAAWHVRHSGDRRMSQQSTAWGGTAARAGFMGAGYRSDGAYHERRVGCSAAPKGDSRASRQLFSQHVRAPPSPPGAARSFFPPLPTGRLLSNLPEKGERRSDAICSCPRLRYGLSSAQPSRQHL